MKMHRMILLVFGLLGLASVGSAQIVQEGQCNTISSMQNFVLDSFTGTWYEIGKSSASNADCSNLAFTVGADNAISFSNPSVVNNFLQTSTGTATLTAGTAQFAITLTGSTAPFNFWVLGSDYDNYGIAISCTDVGTTQRELIIWQLGRAVNSYETAATLAAANTLLATISLSVSDLTPIDHSTAACTQLPVIGANQPVILDGQCNNAAIPVVQNFDVTGFSGIWHETSSYYSANAVGTCARAEYTLVGTTVNVVNSQVLDQRLDTITGTATLIGTDQSGRLSVTLNVGGVQVNQELLILETDYTNYAISYSCINTSPTQRQVNAWILSRDQQLSAASQVEVNRVIASLVDLNTEYFQTTDQSATGCFYFPVHQSGQRVVFPGTCDDTIAAVPSFNLGSFIGTWHEVEAYPEEQQTGTCVNHVFSTGIGNTLNLVSNQVVNRTLTSSTGSVLLVSTDGSGRLVLTMIADGQFTEIPYWIIATDYDNYALAYSCVQLDTEIASRAVYSWKLSRSQTLSQASADLINTAMNQIQVLDQQYFETVDQSADGCFVYPDIPAGDPIILEGECGTVTPVANFQATQFTGTWHEIARYASARQSGNCAASQFQSTTENTFTLTQTIVYNERLTTVSGTATVAADGSGTLTATLSDGADLTYTTTLYILDTDYNEFALLYGCENLPGTNNRQIYSWQLSRSQLGFSQAANERISQVITDTLDLLERYYQSTGQTSADCFYYPVFEGTPEAIVLPGTCPTVSGVANFNPTNYLGHWYDVTRYPIESQFGTCPRAEYSLVDGVITIRNTMVVNETLRAQDAIARLSSAGTGLLSVTIVLENGEETVQTTYILDTDYISYSLVYACRNLGDGTSRVYSWILSRTPTLTVEANNAINTIISNTQGLLGDYYQTQTHTDQDCFYVPEPVSGESVLFPGSCAQVTGMQGFEASQYLGWWHEIERYPSDGSPGHCTSATFQQASDGSYNVIETSVYDNVANETTSSAVITQDGVITITRDGATTQWIVLGTDYNTYSLVYACEDVTTLLGAFRRVWSAKHSKTRGLTAEATAAMEPLIEANPVLHDQFYEAVNQSDAACFHYRDDASAQVILSGQCDTSIPVQANFDIDQFSGTWYHIERYPYTANNDGTCIGTKLNVDGDSVSVQHWEVHDETLVVREGTATVSGATVTIRLPVEGSEESVPVEVLILTTDYEGYALAYTCTNINSYQRIVGAFKLSRSRTLNNDARYAIETYMATREEFHQPYFISITQHDDCDEPSSALLVKSSIIIMLVSVFLHLVIRFSCCTLVGSLVSGDNNDLMMLTLIIGFSILGLLGTSAQIIQDGQCNPDITLQAGFNIDNFLGAWYEVSRTDNPQQDGDCSRLSLTSEDGVISISYESVNRNFYDEINGTVSQEEGTAKLSLNLDGLSEPVDFWVLMTDHTTYALTYQCVNINANQRAVYIWQLGRGQTFTELFLALMNTSLNNLLGITLAELRSTDFSEEACYELPVIEENQPILLPGQCDANIPVVDSLDVERFTGLWHEISSYYSESALGTCARAEYTLAGGVVNVVNSQVVNQGLETVTGTATVIDADGGGKLSVTLEIAPGVFADQELWVLATDYSDYAILYSCIDQPNNQKRVYSWITSRTRVQTDAARAAVTEVVDSIMDLNTVYYELTDQSDDGCFYYPEHVVDQPVVFRGSCDMSIPAMANFDVERYMGLWHEIESYPSVFQTGTCNNARYTLDEELGIVDVFNTQVTGQALDTIRGNATIAADAGGTGKLVVTFPIDGTPYTTSTDYWVLDTDYDNYALVYTCYNIDPDTRGVWSWKLSRSKELLAEANTAINAVIASIPVLDDRYYQTRDQSSDGCFYYPVPELGVPVVFPGQCDDGIAAVPNFNLNDFQGVWHEIESYPKIEQTGECISHDFTQGTGTTLNLQSSQIIDQFLTISSGNVAFTSTDGSARLVITIVSDGQVIEIPYWILNTDYTGHALAYSCVNINSDYRGIWSWKLSRTKELSSTATTIIDEAISSIDVLGNEYYERVDQSDPACFYLPDLEPGEPVVIVGQCQTDIPVVQNFNADMFAGRWRLIESYPVDSSTGTCDDTTYTVDGDYLRVVHTQVNDERLNTSQGYANLVAIGNEGKFLVTYPDADPVEYWVLDTDYTSFAIMYACENIDSEWRRVWSWKMSRTTEMTDAAVTSINQIIDSVDVLNNRYYQEVDNTDAGCFYYPYADGNPVVFRGQCNESIPVVTGFNIDRYMGLWYDIESYPQEFQDGTCATATYTLNGVVEVYNTQVVNETLDYIYGSAVADNDDGLAKLLVTFPIAGTDFSITSQYWVLDTDYDNYALVYACDNLSDDSRRVSSWKLSRQKTMSAASETAISAVVDSVQVLSQEYFVTRDHTDDGCFYYPEPEAGKPVVFPGQCDESIQAEPEFNLDRFSGLWHETAAYPKVESEGHCINYEFTTATADSFNLYTTQVIGLDLDETNATVVRTSTDNSAKFTITLTSDGNNIEIPYWILATDYDNYALAYSCNNIDANYREVYSWKLSRAKEMSGASENAISETISGIQVLDDRYFESTSQSDDSCFYLPVLAPEDPVVFVGQCDPNIQVVQNFDPTRYVGRWRLIESYSSEFQTGTCNDATYTIQNDGSVLVYNTQVIDEALDTITGSAVLATADGSGKLIVTFPGAPEPVEYWILDTDYDSYALVYSCANLNSDQRRVWSWKMSRTTELTEAAVTSINQIIDSVDVLNNRYYQEVDNTDAGCFYYPYADGNPVVFRGQCNESIPVVTGFNIDRYMGLWYDIESYPQEFQDGTCATATYTLNGVVEVYNTQVVNETLDYIYGSAVPDNDNGLAKLLVTFPIAGTDFSTTSQYWVLDTDYDNYALVYTCDNLSDDSRRVSSWKLSRQKTMSAASETAISAVLDSVQVLSQEYFVTRDHTDDGCFYYPEPEAGKPVVFPGQCDESIQAEPEFNLDRFSGLWHETAAYPKVESEGHCINYEFTTATADSFNLYTTQVIGLDLDETNATVVRTSTDNSAKFTITLTSDGNNIEIPYWILATDYDSYALAYSCKNIDANYREVYSWKLSRTKEMSGASENAISEAISGIQVLEERYYESTSQSDYSCFYLPVLAPEDPVVFVGQCDPNIQVVQNFDPTRYAGRWRLIESYASEFQTGTCNDATYTIQNDGSVLVYNTQVIDEALDTITGSAVLATADGSGKLLVTFPGAPEPVEYWVLDTDYESYALVYSCVNLNSDQRRVWSWKLSRTTSLTDTAVSAIEHIVGSVNVLDDRYYSTTDHSAAGCFYFPVPDGNPVTFRGECDDSVRVVENFDIERYMGLWYDIESYPQEFQDGTCATATYTLTGDGVLVYNTQVVEQLLDNVNATAVPAADDGLAKFIVTFPVPGTDLTVNVPYWVLDTDYDNYALVYSCSQINDEYRSVTSWKLSRSQELTPAAQTAINAVIDNVQVLDNQYYNPRGHTEEECFYYPDNFGGPVLLNGQCEAQNVVQNFNLNLFAGTWHETARFPSDYQTGECAANEFVINQNSFVLTQTIVYNERLTTVSGPAVVASDGSGIITATLQNGEGVSVEGTLYVLDTDYTEYALLFSCVDVDDTSKQIYSWKLSRSRSGLSQSANDAIDVLVNNNVDLHENYYELTDQSNDGCFHYPVFDETPAAIVLPGPCDDRIQAKADFEVNSYLGRWFEVSKYPQRDQVGECSRAHYSPGQGDAPVDVRNTIVYNQTLEIREGTAVLHSTDGSGLLWVTFVLDDEVVVESNYYVLETDYTSFALVYSCRDLDNGDSEVYSWKLSREPTLSDAANNIIDEVIRNTRGLLEEYYVPTSQSDEDCFYVPELNENAALHFRGQCESVSGVEGFDVSRYAGWWHEIERFPTDGNPGDCTSSQYTSVGNTIQVVDTRVFDLTGQITTGTVVASSNGVLTRTLSNGQVEELVVLATDYETYSLLYSCLNTEDGEYRQVWSAKHSKQQQMTEAAENALAPIIEANQVLYPQFYLTVDQSDEACFHYPEPTGETVILRGQCDDDIPTVQDFDVPAYTGDWYLIEQYPNPHVSDDGTCVGARYTYNFETEEVSVLHWEVVGGNLTSINGTASTDGAKMIITMAVADSDDTTTTELKILQTDYASYSLAYTCTNINQFQREVTAFKFSRTRSLPASAVTAINSYMATRQELDQQYFTAVEQDEDCLEPSSALLVRGSFLVLFVCAVLQMFM
ncbi:uncharacterized protein LOC134673601 [Cydia fagiglandana]|uniref:uncharacterized protein LOC134673601 n=1 Tax=Cydia fagiglandana TaxID=1458189 RepID=UPI002FEE4261